MKVQKTKELNDTTISVGEKITALFEGFVFLIWFIFTAGGILAFKIAIRNAIRESFENEKR